MMKIVLLESLGISQELLDSYVKPLKEKGHEFAAYERNDDPAVQIEEAKDADILIIANMPLKAEVINACPKLKYIDVAFTGVDHVALDTAKAKGIKVSNASGYSTVAVAELTIAMMLDLLRRVPQVDAACRAGGTKAGLVGNELEGKTVALVGTGHIGHRVAELVHAFGAKVIAYNGFSHKADTDLITYLPMKEMMEQADIVSLHCPVTDQSKGLINKETLSYMKPTAFLINEARGPVVVSQDLADALNSGKVYAAGLDVVSTEPIKGDNPLLTAKNCIITPHISWAAQASRQRIMDITVDNIKAFLEGNTVNQVNK
mgnify:CR=1 FL=1